MTFASSEFVDQIGREIAGPDYTEGVQSTLRKGLRFVLAPAEKQSAFWPKSSAVGEGIYRPPPWLTGIARAAVEEAYGYWKRVKSSLLLDAGVLPAVRRGLSERADVQLEITDSDIHERGEFTAVLSISGSRIVHKPRDSRAEQLLSKILAALHGETVFVPTIAEAPGGGYWQEAVCFHTGQISDRTIHACGAVIALCQLIGLTDQHSSNARLNDDRICLVDGETLFHPLASVRQKKVVTSWSEVPVGCTPIITCLIPAWTTDPLTKKPRLANTLVGQLLELHDRRLGWWSHVSETLIAGYDEALTKIDDIHAEVRNLVSDVDSLPLRRIARPTSGYYYLIERAVANCLMTPGLAIEGEIGRLLLASVSAYRVTDEADTLLKGVIPRCVVNVGSAEIISCLTENRASMEELWQGNRDVIRQSIASAAASEEQVGRLLADRDAYRLVDF